MKTGKKERQVIFHNLGLSPFCLAATPRSLGTKISPAAFFQEPDGQ
jgi:hypothetical protein